jgi:NADH:ubiquinone oxidoreductase subunit H
MFANSLNLSTLVHSQARERSSCIFFFPLWPIALLWIICSLAELNRAPMDLPEAEAELVAGYNVEYASIGFALFFIREYSNIILIARLTRILFLGGGCRPFPFSELQERYSFFGNRERK